VVAVAQARAEIAQRDLALISTVMDMGGGETIEGGGEVTYAKCRQAFSISEVLAGTISTGKAELVYGFTERSNAFPGPSQEIAVPIRAKVILLLSGNRRILKAVHDTPENRNLVKSRLERAKKKTAQQSPAGDRPKAPPEE